MNNVMNKIKEYESDMFDFDISPFEFLQTLHLRTKLKHHFSAMSIEEKIELLSVDLKIIQNAHKIANHIGKVYDFSTSSHPKCEWWWHLDQVAKREVVMEGYSFIEAI
ncbi:hypothetical protein O0Q50_19230 [Priestia aryabhattai]|uniref:Uncharacterized protein n=1 Tax=Priestia aryabhattai TaxID=412384 RepID=A0AAX6NBY6_PRIAR|nr:hypothetical protein [Priestia aryabhattai]MDU9693307.1 hypothetical protein [Priestia aryabhattai]